MFKALGVALNTLILVPVVIAVSFLDRDAKLAYRVAQWWVKLNLLLSGVTVRARGLENLEPSRQYVFMSNHRSNADIIAIAWALWNFQLRWVAKKELLRVPLFGWGLRALKMIIVDRSDREGAIESYRRGRERIRRGISVVVFPEGTRGVGDELLPFKKGGFVFALETETPIAPIGIRGAAAVLARKGWRVERGEVEVVIGRPIETAGRSIEDRDRLVQ
ncbi:MAG: lysophospholipid acyltransferase family protein, partial [Candidatus Binatia bacterium]